MNEKNGTNYVPFFTGRNLYLTMVREKGLEPLHLAALEPKSSASTNSATRAVGRRLYLGAQALP